MRELQATKYSSEAYSDDNMLMNFKLLNPVQLSKNLTWLWGKDDSSFPLLTYTEGNGAISTAKPMKLNDTQYTWKVMGRMRNTSRVIGLYNTALDEPGVGHTEFQVVFEDDWIIKDYGILSPDGEFQARVQGDPVRLADNKYLYTFVSQHSDSTKYCATDNFDEGKAWLMTAPAIASSKSDGNRSNKMGPGELTNQFGFYRYSTNIAGNVANKVMPIEFKTKGGGTS